MSVAVDVEYPIEGQVESAGTGRLRQTHQNPLGNRKSALGRPPSSEKSKTHTFDQASLRETIRQAQLGDSSAFEKIYRLHAGRVHALCLRMLRDPVEAEDLTQEAFMQLFRKLNTFRGESAFSTWLYRLTFNVVLMHLRKKSLPAVSIGATGNQDDEAEAPAIDASVPDLLLEGSIDRLCLERCINQLPAGYRTIFVLHDVQGYQHSEIAEIVGRSVGDSKSQLHKARMRMRQLLHEVQREKARDARLAERKVGSRSHGGLVPLTADGL